MELATWSTALVGLFHASANATAAGSIVGAGLLDRLYPGGTAAWSFRSWPSSA